MRILYLSDSTIPSRTANSVHVMKMCQAFADNGHEVELLAPEREPVSAERDDAFSFYAVRPVFTVTRIARSRQKWGTLQYAFRAARYAQRTRPDLVFGRDVYACFLAALRGLPVVLELHLLTYVRRLLRHGLPFAMLLRAKSFRYLVVISQALASDVIALYPNLKGRVLIAHDGADPVADGAGVAELRSRDGALRAGYIGHVYPGRGLELLEEIARRLPWLDLHIVGDWSERQGGAGPGGSLPSNVHLHGFLSYAEAERVRLACDVLLAPYQKQVYTGAGADTSRWMSPMKIFEYMAAGKAIVCSDIAVLHEVLTHEQTAWFCPPDDVDAWCSALTKLRDDAVLRQGLGSAAKATFLRLYTWRSRAAAVLESPAVASGG